MTFYHSAKLTECTCKIKFTQHPKPQGYTTILSKGFGLETDILKGMGVLNKKISWDFFGIKCAKEKIFNIPSWDKKISIIKLMFHFFY